MSSKWRLLDAWSSHLVSSGSSSLCYSSFSWNLFFSLLEIASLLYWFRLTPRLTNWEQGILSTSDDTITVPVAKQQVKLNLVVPVRFERNYREIMLKLISVNDGWGFSCETTLMWLSLDPTYDKSTMVQVMASWQDDITSASVDPNLCCHMASLGHNVTAPSHYLNPCWPKSMLPYGVTRPQWVNLVNFIWYHNCSCCHAT